MNYRVHVD